MAKWIAAAACLAAASCVKAQTEPASQTSASTIRVQSNLVVLDVVVTDEHGGVVSGLKPEDFRITQNGAPQKARSFEAWSTREPLPDTPTLDRFGHLDWGDAPLNIFVLDTLTTPFEESLYAASMLKKYFAAQPAQLAAPAMLLVVSDAGYRTLQDYTRSRDTLLAKLASRPPSIPAQFNRASADDALTAQTLALLQQIALSSAGLRKHKNIIWLGRGFPAIDPSDLPAKSQASVIEAIRSTASMLLDARVTVYKVDPMPTTTALTQVDQSASLDIGADARTLDAPDEDPLADNVNLNLFAVQTGGRYFFGLNSLDRYLAESVSDGSRFYTLSYAPPTVPTDAYQSIRVTMLRPGLTARARQGYYGAPQHDASPNGKELGFALGQAAGGGMAFTGVGVRILGVESGKDVSTASITFAIANQTLRWQPREAGGETAEVTAVLVALNAKHEILDSAAYKLHPFLQAKDASLAVTGEIKVKDSVLTRHGTAALRVVVRDASGRIGTADVSAEQMQLLIAAQKGSHSTL